MDDALGFAKDEPDDAAPNDLHEGAHPVHRETDLHATARRVELAVRFELFDLELHRDDRLEHAPSLGVREADAQIPVGLVLVEERDELEATAESADEVEDETHHERRLARGDDLLRGRGELHVQTLPARLAMDLDGARHAGDRSAGPSSPSTGPIVQCPGSILGTVGRSAVFSHAHGVRSEGGEAICPIARERHDDVAELGIGRWEAPEARGRGGEPCPDEVRRAEAGAEDDALEVEPFTRREPAGQDVGTRRGLHAARSRHGCADATERVRPAQKAGPRNRKQPGST